MSFNDFEEYKKQGEPSQKQKAENWGIAIGLQAVDGLKPSKYLIELAKKNIEGKISSKQLKEKIYHLADFISNIWQIHPFAEGNTRTFAVFAIKYLKAIGFEANNEYFELNAKYFRNALVRANYQDLKNDVTYSNKYLYDFFENLL